MKVSDYIAEFLIEHEVTDIFGYPGGMVAHLMDSLSKYSDKIKVHTNYHEQASAFAANAYAQVSGKIGVAYSSSGPGATNMITGICNAYYDSIPVLFITGQVNSFESKKDLPIRQKGFQESDIISMVKSVTKYCVYIEKAEDIRYELEKAVYLAKEGRPGPVLVDIPMNIQRGNIEPDKLCGYDEISDNMETPQVDEVIHKLKEAERPVLLVGSGVKSQRHRELVRKLVDKLQIPVVSSMIAVDVIPTEYPNNYGFLGAYGNRTANFIIAKSDLILAVGSRMDVRQVGGKRENFAPEALLIRVDIDEGELFHKVNSKEQHVCMDAGSFLEQILEKDICLKDKNGKWNGICVEIEKELANMDERTPNKIIKKMGKIAPDNCIITTDVGQNQVWVAQSFAIKPEQKILFSGGLGSMGYSLPAAIGAYYGERKPVICFNGDGGIQMNIQELQFVAREALPIAIVVFNNQALGMIRHFQEMYFEGNYTQTVEGEGYAVPDFESIAKGYHIKYVKVTCMEQITEEMFQITEPVFIEVELKEDTYVFPKLEFGKPNQDQEPLMDRQLYQRLMDL